MVRNTASLVVIAATLFTSGCAGTGTRGRAVSLKADGLALAGRPHAGAMASDWSASVAGAAESERPGWRPVARRVVLFIPDRIMDVFDIVTFGVGVGYGFDIDRHVTYYGHVPTVGWYRSFNFLNWNHNRNLCYAVNKEAEAGFGPFFTYNSEFAGKGTGWDEGEPGSGEKAYAKKPMIAPDDPIYEEGYRDPWALGVAYGPFLLSPRVELDVHPVAIADFVVGTLSLGFLDISRDDWARE